MRVEKILYNIMTEKRDFSEIEVDLDKPAPLNKKQKRLEKKGKLKTPKPVDEQTPKRSPHAVWIGNLSYETTPKELTHFIAQKSNGAVEEQDILRVHLPPKRGFAYVDLASAEQATAVIALSESQLSGRNLLIKDAKSYAGRPGKPATDNSNAPSRVLFVGNLSFDTTDDDLQMHFQHCGEISRIRTATFQDSGKCKGFSFIDFFDVEACKRALGDKRCRRLNGRYLRMEYGEDRSKRKSQRDDSVRADHSADNGPYPEVAEPAVESTPEVPPASDTQIAKPAHDVSTPREKHQPKKRIANRPTPGQALSNATRAKQSIKPSEGKNITFA